MNVNDLLNTLARFGYSPDAILSIRRAYDFAAKAHERQKRKSGAPYITHPLSTALRLAEMRLDTATIAAALLHDVCEDTSCTAKDLAKTFGDEIAFLVEGVTKLDKIRYRGTERSAESLRKMFLAVAEDVRIVLIKLVDRLHNMETLSHIPPEKQKRIALETLEIYAPLAYRLGIGELKGQLEDLAFPYVYPKEYEWVVRMMKDHDDRRRYYMENLSPLVTQELARERIPFESVHTRTKHLYSLYKKLLKYDMDITKVYDLAALRVIVETVEHCYAALGVIHKLWKPVPGLVKDYIALPKPNGYRSLHTTVFGPEGHTVECQIRTRDMHEEAENGIAAHWAYSEWKGDTSYRRREASFAPRKELVWIQQLREWQKEFKKPEEFLEALKIDFFKNRIFVLTPKGDVLDLPEGATPVDFAYQVHTDIGRVAAGARVNNKMVPLDFQLRNGDVVEILIQKNKKPSSDWLHFVRSAHARKKILAFFRKEREGKSLVTKRRGETADLRIAARDRVGLLRDISSVVARHKFNVKNVVTDHKRRLYPILTLQVPVRNRADLEKLMVRLKEIKGVREVSIMPRE